MDSIRFFGYSDDVCGALIVRDTIVSGSSSDAPTISNEAMEVSNPSGSNTFVVSYLHVNDERPIEATGFLVRGMYDDRGLWSFSVSRSGEDESMPDVSVRFVEGQSGYSTDMIVEGCGWATVEVFHE